LLREVGFDFEVLAPDYVEPVEWLAGHSPAEHARAVSLAKARSVEARVAEGLILAADTVVALGGRWHGTPTDREDARRILQALSGSTHEVFTGVAVISRPDGKTVSAHDRTLVTMRTLTAESLEAYLDSGEWAGKAGAYGIQDRNDPFIERIEGSYTNVVGLPVELVRSLLTSFGCSGQNPARS
jgi:septum formation protein